MTLIGSTIANVPVGAMGPSGPVVYNTDEVFAGKLVALFGLPGAFTSTCSERHLPGFIANVQKFRSKGVDTVACLSVNDAWVMQAWFDAAGADDAIAMLADGALNLTSALGLEVDLRAKCYGIRCKRFSMIVRDRVIVSFHEETQGGFGETSAEKLLVDLENLP